jgi:hypothetical protein
MGESAGSAAYPCLAHICIVSTTSPRNLPISYKNAYHHGWRPTSHRVHTNPHPIRRTLYARCTPIPVDIIHSSPTDLPTQTSSSTCRNTNRWAPLCTDSPKRSTTSSVGPCTRTNVAHFLTCLQHFCGSTTREPESKRQTLRFRYVRIFIRNAVAAQVLTLLFSWTWMMS